jgi:anti-sigma regulatory factor (Ser/Thr protein kinase)
MSQAATVRLELDSKPESVTLVRAVLSAVAEAEALDGELLNDLKTAASEACNNVVVHAYGDVPGPLLVEVESRRSGVSATVRDYGVGMHSLASTYDGMGVGLAVISALAARAEFVSPPNGGTEVRMWFPISAPGMQPLARAGDSHRLSETHRLSDTHRISDADGGGASKRERASTAWQEPALQLSGDVVVTLSPVSLMTPVLGRLARALAAGARFSFDRFSDVYLVADTIGAHAQRAAASENVSFSLESAGKQLELVMGPFAQGSGAQFQRSAAAQANDSPLTLLADEILVTMAGRAETLHVVLRDHGTRVRENSL